MKTAEFGKPIERLPVPGKCRICGCTETTTCLQTDMRRNCGWADETRTLCDHSSCLAAARAELTLHPLEAEVLQRPFTGKRYGFAPRPR